MSKHTVTMSEMKAIHVEVVMASSSEGKGKRLMFTYDVGRRRLEYIVSTRDVHPLGSGDAFDTLEEAVEAYNEL